MMNLNSGENVIMCNFLYAYYENIVDVGHNSNRWPVTWRSKWELHAIKDLEPLSGNEKLIFPFFER
jgi:hypothetical protein